MADQDRVQAAMSELRKNGNTYFPMYEYEDMICLVLDTLEALRKEKVADQSEIADYEKTVAELRDEVAVAHECGFKLGLRESFDDGQRRD